MKTIIYSKSLLFLIAFLFFDAFFLQAQNFFLGLNLLIACCIVNFSTAKDVAYNWLSPTTSGWSSTDFFTKNINYTTSRTLFISILNMDSGSESSVKSSLRFNNSSLKVTDIQCCFV